MSVSICLCDLDNHFSHRPFSTEVVLQEPEAIPFLGTVAKLAMR